MSVVTFTFSVTCVLVIVLTVSFQSPSSEESRGGRIQFDSAGFVLPYLVNRRYAVLGDVNIGALMSITDHPKDLMCNNTIRQDPWLLPAMEAIAFAVDLVKRNPLLLPNVTLGFVIVDYCRSSSIALAQTLSFLPTVRSIVNATSNVTGKYKQPLASATSSPSLCTATNTTPAAIPPTVLKSTDFEYKPLPHYDVVGVLGPQASTSTIYMSSLMSVARVPVISYMATSDELSDKQYHPYLLRLVPPDKHQVQAMLTFIADNGWSYVSVVHGDTTYGDMAFEKIKEHAPKFNICLATCHRVNAKTDFDSVIKNLLSFETARVVILFAETDPILNLLAASNRAGAKGHFIWIGSDSLADKIILRGKFLEELHGAFTFMYYSRRVPEFEKHFKQLRPNMTANPWFEPFWQMLGQCSFSDGSCWTQKAIANVQAINIPSSMSLVIDSVLTFAYGMHELLSDLCPEHAGYDARLCVRGDLLLSYMLNSSFDGFTGKISFDKNGDFIGKYVIRQLLWTHEVFIGAHNSSSASLVEVQVACYERLNRSISYRGRPISWNHLNMMPHSLLQSEQTTHKAFHPESVCSRPCRPDQYRIQKELPCCWNCGSCRANERLVEQNTACEKCQQFWWPDPETNFTTCVPIPLSYASLHDIVSIIEVCLACVFIVCLLCVAATYFHYRHHGVIKAASKELSALQMLAILFAYVTVILLQTAPNHAICGVIYFLFCLSFACLYSPLIVKAVRIYRIFLQGSKNSKQLRLTSPQSQLLIAGSLSAIQTLISTAMYLIYQPTAAIAQPADLEPFVELYCDFNLPSLTSFLAYSLFLVTLSLVFSFKTRKLPDNFKESRFVSMCASTTMIIWLAVVPAYFTATFKIIRVLLLSLALLLNHTVALIVLFVPKIYALLYVDQESVVNGKFQTKQLSNKVNFPDISNRIAPVSIDRSKFEETNTKSELGVKDA